MLKAQRALLDRFAAQAAGPPAEAAAPDNEHVDERSA